MDNGQSERNAEVRQAGRGVFLIAFAKGYFMLAGAAISFLLPRFLSVQVFGAWQNVTNTVSLLNNVTVTGTIQTVSKFVAQDPDNAKQYQRAGFRMHLFVGAVLAGGFIVAAPWIASWYHDEAKTNLFRLAGTIIGLYSFYAVFVGTANGRKEFHKQAQLDITMASMRAVGILGLAGLGYGVWGALTGWVTASVIILVVAALVVGRSEGGASQGKVPMLMKFFFGVAVYLVLLNLIMFVDGFVMKRLAAEWFAANPNGWTTNDIKTVADAADQQIGLYGAAQILSRLSYQAILAAAFVIFPLISATTFAQDKGATQRYIRTTLRYSLLFAMGLGTVFAASPDAVLSLGFKVEYAASANALACLGIGYVGFALFAIAGTILNGAGETRTAILSAVITFLVAAIGNYVMLADTPAGPEMLTMAGAVTGIAMVIGAVVSISLLKRKLGAGLSWVALGQVAAASGAAIALGRLLSLSGKVGAFLECAAVGILYLIGLVVTRALTKEHLQDIVNLRKK